VGYRIVLADQSPDLRTISEFRRIHLKALKGLFVQVLRLAGEAGLVKLGHVALDGTKVKANASKHKAMSYGRMPEKERQYEREIDELLKQPEEMDREEGKLEEKDRPIAPKRGRPAKRLPGQPKPSAQHNCTDPESRIMKMDNKAFDQSYNYQAAADEQKQVTVACEVTKDANDKHRVEPMVKKIKEAIGSGRDWGQSRDVRPMHCTNRWSILFLGR